MNSNSDFVELSRTFHELSKDSGASDDADFTLAFLGGEQLSWSDLIKEYRLIILSEAGSGKTTEIRNAALGLRQQGRPAFFLRLEHISNDFEFAFEVGSYEEFANWLAGGIEGWLLLDSVDEARLRHPRDFENAIRKLSSEIGAAKGRAHIVITSRTTAWRPKSDLDLCVGYLPFTPAITAASDSISSDHNPEESLLTKTVASDKESIFKIVTFDDLNPKQVGALAQALGVEDSTAFLDAVERAGAWADTSRPEDVEELAEFWLDKGLIGRSFEIMQNSLNRRLAERDQDRADSYPLSVERSRYGAKLLAAVTTLSQNQLVRVPDGTKHLKGIDVQSVLPDWDDKDQSILLSRPIFDNAIYGAVRFHKRSTREYLCAEWFADLLKQETSRRNIEALFFRNQYGVDIVVPALRPILPWLAILDEKISERVRKIAPEIIFEGGDPSRLPLIVRRDILDEVCEQIAKGTGGRSALSHDGVQHFSDPDLNRRSPFSDSPV